MLTRYFDLYKNSFTRYNKSKKGIIYERNQKNKPKRTSKNR